MAMSLPTTRGQWIAAGIAVVVIVAVLGFFTDTFVGRAVEVSLENAGGNAVFAYIDSGRHGKNTETTTVKTTDNRETPAGLKVYPRTTGSFGHAVGLFDQPTLHVIPLTEGQPADLKLKSDCSFNTVSFNKLKKLEIPSFHVRIKWNGACPPQES